MKEYMDKVLAGIECAQFASKECSKILPLPSSDEIGIIAAFCIKNDIPYIAAVKLIILKPIAEAWNRQYINNVVFGINGKQFVELDSRLKEFAVHEAANNQ